jgi:hypothetical protein
MNLELSLKTQNIRSFNFSETGLTSMRTKVKAAILESDDVIILTNVQIGKNRRVLEREFLLGGKTPYEIFTNSNASESRGVLIAVKIRSNIKIIDTAKDDEDRLLLIKAVVGNETVTIGGIYDDNRNNIKTLLKLEELIDSIDGRQGLIMGGDYNVILDQKLDQFGYDTPHARTKAVAKLKEWEESKTLTDIYRKTFKKGNATSYVPDTEHDRENPSKGRRLDKFLVSEDLLIKEVKIQHVSDNKYKTELNMKKKFDHGSVRLQFNKKKGEVGPGQFKVDPYLISTGALDNVAKQVIYEANIYNSEIKEIIQAYEDRNTIVRPQINTILEIQKQRKQEGDITLREAEEQTLLDNINRADEKLPTIEQLHEINKDISDRILTEIQLGITSRVRDEQILLKKAASNELKDITRNLSELTKKLENNPTEEVRLETLEAKEKYNAKYETYFKREAAKTSMFNQINIEKPTKWFLNLASDKMSSDSPTVKLKKYCDKYKDTEDWGKKYETKEEVHEDMYEHFKNIFDIRPRKEGTTIESFLKEIKDNPETIGKKLTDAEKEANDKVISLEELTETLEAANAGKTPGIDGVDKGFLTRYWSLLGQTIQYAQKSFIEKEKLNEFLDTGLIKVLQKGGTKGELIKDWRPITLLSQIYKLISGVIARRIKKHLSKLISGCQKAYQNTNNIGEIILDVLETIAISNFHKKPGMILLIDFSKAFDSISHDFIYETLEFFNFGSYFIKIVKTMLNSRKCNIMVDGHTTKQFNILRGVPQGDTASPYLFILVLEILLLRIKHDKNITLIKFETPGYTDMDGGKLTISPLLCFADDMTAIMEETEENLVIMKNIFQAFKDLSGLEINEGKTKIIRIGDKLDNTEPLTNKVKFKYVKTFKLLGVDIDNKLEDLPANFITRKKKIRQKIAIWRKLNLSTTGNLIISKTFLISQLGYLLSMMDCPKEILEEIQKDIDAFIMKTRKPWISKDRLYLPPELGGLGAINLVTYATSLRCSWYKRVKSGLWTDILMEKVWKKENICFIKENDFHAMHIAIRPIARAMENLQCKFVENKDDLIQLKRPLERFKVVKDGRSYVHPTKENCPYLYKPGGICEISAYDLTNKNSIQETPRFISNEEIIDMLNIGNLNYLERGTIISKTRAIWKKAIENKSFKSSLDETSLKEVFNKTKKGSRKYKTILTRNEKVKNIPGSNIVKKWNIDRKYNKEIYLKKTFGFWKTSFLPSKLQTLHLQIINHKLKFNDQLKHFARDENNQLISGKCTFCVINNVNDPSEETYHHLFAECLTSTNALIPVARKYNINIPDFTEDGEKILYYFPQEKHWEEVRTNLFFLIYKYYINNCRLRKTIPTENNLERTVKNEVRNIAQSNPTNDDLTEHLVPIWTGRELTKEDRIEILEEYEGNDDKGKFFIDVNKKSIILNTKLHLGFGFPCEPGTSKKLRLNDVRNHQKMTQKLMKPTIRKRKNGT